MKTHANPAVTIGALAGGVAVLAFTTVLGFVESRGLRAELSRVRSDANEARQAHAEAETEIALHRGRLGDLQRQVAALQDAADDAPTPAIAGPARARIVRGNQIVGTGWVVTSTNGVTGQPDVNVVLETPVQVPAAPAVNQAPDTPAAREYRFAYWYQQPLYTWGTLVGDYPYHPHCTNDSPGFAPPPRPAPVAGEPSPPVASPPSAAPVAMTPRATRNLPLRPTPVPPVVTRPPVYYPTVPAPVARSAAPATPAVRPAPAVARSRPTPLPTPVRTPAPRIQPLPARPL